MKEKKPEKTPLEIDVENELKPLLRIGSSLKERIAIMKKEHVLLKSLKSHKTDVQGFESLSWVDVSVIANDLQKNRSTVLETLKSLWEKGIVYRSELNVNVFMAKYI